MANDVGMGLLSGLFKSTPNSVAFTCPTTQTVSLGQNIRVAVGGTLRLYSSGLAVTLPTLVAGTDYAIYACADGTLQASSNFSAPSGYTTANSRQVGGFHYAGGSNATAQAGGDTTPQINPYSLWDLKWRPACADPRGMALVAGRFWADIYLTGTDVELNGSSRWGVTIADGSSPPKVPTMFGGDGTTTYGSFNWYQAREVLGSVGKDLLRYDEFILAAYGTSEAVARGSDAVTTGLSTTNTGSSNADAKFTSKWGLVQSTGSMLTWTSGLVTKLTVPAAPTDATALATSINTMSWRAATGGRGSLNVPAYADGVAVPLVGGGWADAANAGSRSAHFGIVPTGSYNTIGARGRADHFWSI